MQTPCGSSPWCTHIHFRRSSFHAHAFLPVITQCRPADINRGKRAAAPVSNSRAPFSSSRNHQVKGKKEASNSPLYSPVSLPPFPSGRRIDVRPKLETKVVTLTLHLRCCLLWCLAQPVGRIARPHLRHLPGRELISTMLRLSSKRFRIAPIAKISI